MRRNFIVTRGFVKQCWLLVLFWLGSVGIGHTQTVLDVTNFGAVGDAVWFRANTTSNSVIATTTNTFTAADVGKVIKLFATGPVGTAAAHQDTLAIITNVVSGTNLYMNRLAGATVAWATGVHGTNNLNAFQACIDAAGSNDVVYIPDGTYFLVGTQALDSAFVAGLFTQHGTLKIHKGGLTFRGQSQAGTVLLGNGAWQRKPEYVYRGTMFQIVGPITNAGPLVFENLTMDGGVLVGLTPNNIFWPASEADGSGWDTSHGAVVWSGDGPLHSQTIFRNCTVTRWRGEQVKCNVAMWDGPAPGPALVVSNCTFNGGSATALNAPLSHSYISNTFLNLAQVEEFYQGYSTNVSVFSGNVASNIVGSMMAIVGALTNSVNPAYTIQDNTFYFTFPSAAGIQMLPSDNIIIRSNRFIATGENYGTAVNVGASGAQGDALPRNTVITGNWATNLGTFISAYGGSTNTFVTNNTFYGANVGSTFIRGIGGGQSNIVLVGNFASANIAAAIDFTASSGQFPLVDLSNNFPPYQYGDFFGSTNRITYGRGSRHVVGYTHSGSLWTLDDTAPAQIPAGARMLVINSSDTTLSVHRSSLNNNNSITMTNGYAAGFVWTNGFWQQSSSVTPPSNFQAIDPSQ